MDRLPLFPAVIVLPSGGFLGYVLAKVDLPELVQAAPTQQVDLREHAAEVGER
ncbi:MAG: hypothetical protein U0872_16300 [Planctomycetaceae bacterium]